MMLNRDELLARREVLIAEARAAHELMMEASNQLRADRARYGIALMRTQANYSAAAELWVNTKSELDQVIVDLSWAS